ncbi:MAG: hypothetical protein COA78_04690 [Blastopirellula sp.]|nr:MAG: hypothetical protein COA78_04690 [Blastopirellula sp.]
MNYFPTKQWIHHVAILGAFLLLASQALGEAEEFDVKLGPEAQRDPIIEYIMPPSGSPDKVRFTSAGILVTQSKDQKDKKTGVTGFKVLVNSAGDFKFDLDVECRKMVHPTSGWGHGIAIRIIVDDPEEPLLMVSCATSPQGGRVYRYSPVRSPESDFDSKTIPCNFQKGTLTAQRTGSEFIFSVQELGKEPEEIGRVPCSTASISGIHVWCTRIAKGNSEAEYLLKNVKFKGEEMFTYADPPASFPWLWVLGFIVAPLAAISAGVLWYKNNAEY